MKTVIEMALEAGFLSNDESCGIYAQSDFDGLICIEEYAVGEKVKRFAELVRAEERAKFFTPEEARIALEDTDFTWHHSVTQDMVEKLEAIRARGEASIRSNT